MDYYNYEIIAFTILIYHLNFNNNVLLLILTKLFLLNLIINFVYNIYLKYNIVKKILYEILKNLILYINKKSKIIYCLLKYL